MRSQLTGWLLLAPTLLILFVFGVVPFIYVLVTGFFDWNAFAADPTPRFAGVDNYRQLVFDDQFLYSVWLTLRFAFFAVVSEIVLGYFLAQLFLRDFPLQGLLPHHPRPAADGRADRGRGDLAAPDRPRPRAAPLLSRQVVRHRFPHRQLPEPGVR